MAASWTVAKLCGTLEVIGVSEAGCCGVVLFVHGSRWARLGCEHLRAVCGFTCPHTSLTSPGAVVGWGWGQSPSVLLRSFISAEPDTKPTFGTRTVAHRADLFGNDTMALFVLRAPASVPRCDHQSSSWLNWRIEAALYTRTRIVYSTEKTSTPSLPACVCAGPHK